ncbi:MAG: ketopantoate reductase family protein [Actinobacteria bacterium]|nr:ketopantoate reductase family protein [Actinomycetota bacterium]
MRYVILGAGAIGATIGGRLAEAGCRVTLVGRGQHAMAVKKNGLLLAMPDRTVRLAVEMLTLDELRLHPDDVLFVAVKSQDTAALLNQLAAVPVDGAAGDPAVFCAQNGVANEDAMLRYSSRVYGVCVSIPATHLEPGVVESSGTPVGGVMQLGRYPVGTDDLVSAVASDLNRSGFRADGRADVMAWKRAKLLSNLMNALQVLCVGGYEWRAGNDGAIGTVVSRMRAEAMACFEAAHLPVIAADQFRAEAGGFQIAPVNGRSRGGGSTWQSVERGLPSVETDFLNGEIVRLGRLLDVPTPVNAAVTLRMREITSRSLAPRTLDPAELLEPGPG